MNRQSLVLLVGAALIAVSAYLVLAGRPGSDPRPAAPSAAPSTLESGAVQSGAVQPGLVLKRVRDKGVLVMSTDPEYPPQSSMGPNNEFIGFDIDVGREIARRLGVGIAFVTPGFDVIVDGHWNGRWDLSVGSVTPTAKRRAVLDFPAIYYFTPAALAVHRDNASITSPEAASGKRLGVGVATTYESYLKGQLDLDVEGAPPVVHRIKGALVQVYDTDNLALDDLKIGDGARLDGVVTALPTIRGAIDKGYPIKVVGQPLYQEPLAVATDKIDPAFGAEIARIIAAMHADGTLAELSRKWYGVDLTNGQAAP